MNRQLLGASQIQGNDLVMISSNGSERL